MPMMVYVGESEAMVGSRYSYKEIDRLSFMGLERGGGSVYEISYRTYILLCE